MDLIAAGVSIAAGSLERPQQIGLPRNPGPPATRCAPAASTDHICPSGPSARFSDRGHRAQFPVQAVPAASARTPAVEPAPQVGAGRSEEEGGPRCRRWRVRRRIEANVRRSASASGLSTIIVSNWASVAPPSFSAGMISSNSRVMLQPPSRGVPLICSITSGGIQSSPLRDWDVEVLREEHPVGVAPLQERQDGGVALLGRQEDVEPVAVPSRCRRPLLEQALDVAEVVAVAGVGDLDPLRRGPPPRAGSRSARGPVSEAGREWAMTGTPVRTLARAAARWSFSTFGVMPGSSAAHLTKAAFAVGPLDPLLDVVDVEVGDRSPRCDSGGSGAGSRRCRRRRRRPDLKPGLGREPDRGREVAAEEHRGRLDHGSDHRAPSLPPPTRSQAGARSRAHVRAATAR